MSDLASFLRLLRFTHLLRGVERATFIDGRNENDAEHSFQLALAVWYVASTKRLRLDLEKALRYALVHDLVEAYAGDVSAFACTPEVTLQKDAAEHAALLRLEREFPEFGSMTESIRAYEARADDEARFVYALDKVLPMANIYLEGGTSWRRQNVTLDMLKAIKETTTAVSPDVYPYWLELRAIFEANEAQLFCVAGDTSSAT